jgi:ABC-type Fe3+ transport system permease subunit
LIFIALLTLICSNPLVSLLAFIPFIIWSEYLSGRFEKRMESYKPPKRYKGLNRIWVGWFIVPLFLLLLVYFFSVIVLIFKIVPSFL